MRGNGLRAAAYIGVADLHPQVADVMLLALADEGVAAYAAPVASTRGLLMPTQFPSGPTDRLFVDRDSQDTAWRVLDQHLPGARAELEHVQVEAVPSRSAGDDAPAEPGHEIPGDPVGEESPSEARSEQIDDETWQGIVAAFHGTDEGSRWPDAENVSPENAEDRSSEGRQPFGPALRMPDRDVDNHFHPPVPPPLPVADTTTRMAWAGVVGGPLLFLLALLLDWDLASWTQLAGVAGLVLGFVTLVSRMRDDRQEDTDDGAVV